MDQIRFKQSEVLPERLLDAVEQAIGVRLTGADATFDIVDPGENPKDLKPGLHRLNVEMILNQTGASVVDGNGESSAWVNRSRAEADAAQYGVPAEVMIAYFAAQEPLHSYLGCLYDGVGGKPDILIQDNEVIGEAASSYIDPDLAARRVLDIVAGVTTNGTNYDKLAALGTKALEDVARKYDLKNPDGWPLDIKAQLIPALQSRLLQVPHSTPTVPEALKVFEGDLSALKGSNGFTPAAFVRDLQDEIVRSLRTETKQIMRSLESESYGAGETAPKASAAGSEMERLLRDMLT